MADKIDLKKAVEVTGETNYDLNQTVWSSPVERKLTQMSEGKTLEELVQSGQILDANGVPCPPMEKKDATEREKSQYYNAWLYEMLKGKGLLFYEKSHQEAPKKIVFDKKKNDIFITRRSVLPTKIKKPGYFERRRDRKLREAGKPGTPAMIEYRRKLYMRDQAAANLARNAAYEKEHFAPIAELKQRSLENLNRLAKLKPEQFNEKMKAAMLNDLTNIMVCDSYRRLEKEDPTYAKMLMGDISDALKEKKTGPIVMFGEKEQEIVRMNVGAIQTPAALTAFLSKPNRLGNAYMSNFRVQMKSLTYRDVEFTKEVDGKTVADEQATESYDALVGKADSALDHLKELTATNGLIPGKQIEQVKNDIAMIALQNAVARLARTNKGAGMNELMAKLTDEPTGKGPSNLSVAVEHFKEQYVSKLNVENMTGKDLAKLLTSNGEQKIAFEFILKNKLSEKNEANLKKNIFGKKLEAVEKKAAPQQKEEPKKQELSIEHIMN